MDSTILVVDDEQKIRNTYKTLFEREGYQVIACSNIMDARKYIKAVPVELMLLDINMGEYRGDILYEVSQCFHKRLKIIVSSVYPVDEQKNLMPNAFDFFDKSEGNKVLLEKVRKAFYRKKPGCKNIIVVDDDMRERRIMHYLLTQYGYNSVEFSDNIEFLKYLDKKKTSVDLIVLDLAMPKITGIDFYEMIREKCPDAKILIASNYSVSEQQTYIFDADDYCDKTDGTRSILEKIENLLRKEAKNEKV